MPLTEQQKKHHFDVNGGRSKEVVFNYEQHIYIFLRYIKLTKEVRARGTQREYSSKPHKHSMVERILVFKR